MHLNGIIAFAWRPSNEVTDIVFIDIYFLFKKRTKEVRYGNNCHCFKDIICNNKSP